MKRTDIPLDGIETVRAQLEKLDFAMSPDSPRPIDVVTARTIVLGILARLDAAIVDIHES